VGEKGRWKRVLLKRYLERGIREVGTDDSEEVSPVVHQTCHHVWGCWRVETDCSGDTRLRKRIWIKLGMVEFWTHDA